MELKDKVIVVTGGGQGLGRAIACGLAAKGAVLALVDLNPERLEESVELCREAGGNAKAYVANVASEDEVVGLPEEIAHTAVFLFENDYINGRVIETDGGIRL